MGDAELVYVHCTCGGQIKKPFRVTDSVYSVAETHRPGRGQRTCRIIVTVFPDSSTAVERVAGDESFEDVLATAPAA